MALDLRHAIFIPQSHARFCNAMWEVCIYIESPYHTAHMQNGHFTASNLILTPHQVQKIKMKTKQQIKTIKTPKCPWIKTLKCPWILTVHFIMVFLPMSTTESPPRPLRMFWSWVDLTLSAATTRIWLYSSNSWHSLPPYAIFFLAFESFPIIFLRCYGSFRRKTKKWINIKQIGQQDHKRMA
jgi:hypothetical protein